ncbi:hypothetical protein RA261_27360, partial [Pseudomonas syringae pv. tagetis]
DQEFSLNLAQDMYGDGRLHARIEELLTVRASQGDVRRREARGLGGVGGGCGVFGGGVWYEVVLFGLVGVGVFFCVFVFCFFVFVCGVGLFLWGCLCLLLWGCCLCWCVVWLV